MAMLAERERLEKERHLHELEMQLGRPWGAQDREGGSGGGLAGAGWNDLDL